MRPRRGSRVACAAVPVWLRVGALAWLLVASVGCPSKKSAPPGDEAAPAATVAWGMVIHGGAGVIKRADFTPEREAAVRAALEAALRAGHGVLARGGSSVDAVTAALVVLEDSPRFNAGKGAVFTHEGTNELDASIMNGATRGSGAVAGVQHVKNPVLLARRVMEASPHVMMAGQGAEAFARAQGLELVPAAYFRTEERWQQLQRVRGKSAPAPARGEGDEDGDGDDAEDAEGADRDAGDHKFGTVGAVALDQSGDLAAATSTGGMTNKRWGRVGDSPIIGAGTYADSRCGISATGHGEFFIRYTVARDICARMEYLGVSLAEAAEVVIHEVLVEAGGEGGVIALDDAGRVVMTFNSAGMYRGYVGADGAPTVAIFE